MTPDVVCNLDMVINEDQQIFLANQHNKAQFICLLRSALKAGGYRTVQATTDADTNVVSVALEETIRYPVTVAADDTDILTFDWVPKFLIFRPSFLE